MTHLTSDTSALLTRIAEALERAHPFTPADDAPQSAAAFRWNGSRLIAIPHFKPMPLKLIVGVDRQRDEFTENVRRHASGAAAHDILLWGVRGAGKSALVKAAVGAVRNEETPLALVECAPQHISSLPDLWTRLNDQPVRFLLFIDDIGYDGTGAEARLVRSLLDGGVEARPDNVRLAVTSNQRNIVSRDMSEQDDPINRRDSVEDSLALADRFGLKLGFQRPTQDDYLAMVAAYTQHFGLPLDMQAALNFAHQRGGQSGRTAWHYITDLAGNLGRNLEY